MMNFMKDERHAQTWPKSRKCKESTFAFFYEYHKYIALNRYSPWEKLTLIWWKIFTKNPCTCRTWLSFLGILLEWCYYNLLLIFSKHFVNWIFWWPKSEIKLEANLAMHIEVNHFNILKIFFSWIWCPFVLRPQQQFLIALLIMQFKPCFTCNYMFFY